MKDSIKTFLLAGGVFGVIMGLFITLASNIRVGAMAGTVLGCIFGSLITVFTLIQSRGFKKNRSKLVENKCFLKEGPANHFKGSESVGGWLYLTKDEIIFESHNINIQVHTALIPLNQISELKTSLTLGTVPNGMQIITNDGAERFVVYNRKAWINEINKAILQNKKDA